MAFKKFKRHRVRPQLAFVQAARRAAGLRLLDRRFDGVLQRSHCCLLSDGARREAFQGRLVMFHSRLRFEQVPGRLHRILHAERPVGATNSKALLFAARKYLGPG